MHFDLWDKFFTVHMIRQYFQKTQISLKHLTQKKTNCNSSETGLNPIFLILRLPLRFESCQFHQRDVRMYCSDHLLGSMSLPTEMSATENGLC